LNNWILPALKYTLKELLLGLVVDTKRTRPEDSTTPVDAVQAAAHIAYAEQQHLDRYDEIVRHAVKHKWAFDKRVLKWHPGEVVFHKGQLVQVYRSDTDYTFKTDQKLIPKWSVPHHVKEWIWNTYKLETLRGVQLPGEFSVRRLWAFEPRLGTKLYEEQEAYMENVGEGEWDEVEREGTVEEQEEVAERAGKDGNEDAAGSF
ncbi:hypothetical protein PISMIDRAFT_107209, partial [Pisolithus microcarpus 441]